MKQTLFCCEGFKLAVENSNRKGLSVAANLNSQNNLVFSLVFRSLDLADDEKFNSLLHRFKNAEEMVFDVKQDIPQMFYPWRIFGIIQKLTGQKLFGSRETQIEATIEKGRYCSSR